MNSNCPYCGEEVTLAAVENPRKPDKWTVLPLDGPFESWSTECNFDLLEETHEAVDIMGEVVGEFPIAVRTSMSPGSKYRTHKPSHYLGDSHD